jgi:uncharacterized RDD family membrane protein YckC
MVGLAALDVMAPGLLTERLANAVFAVLVLAYASLEIVTAGTPGKLLLGLTIANANGTPAPRAVLSLRWSTKYFPLICGLLFVLTSQPLFQIVSGLSEGFVFLGCLFASCDHHQAWHDQWSRTAVYRRRDLARAPAAFPVVPAGSPPPVF